MKTLNNRGFTFTELLIVLTITFTISTAIIFIGKKYNDKEMVDGFLRQFTLDLYAVQSHAFNEGTSTQLQFVSGGTEYVALGNSRKLIFRRSIPKGVKLSANSPMQEISYNKNGTIVHFGTIQFVTDQGDIISLKLQFGRGRVALPEY
ncbi:prepilin-type N-terminal cleavage/methylation domain-containing protein [Chungangia koreensis]|uniref:Prepilin-type N-terminal cleavage/methylation domain-containing protein n=1 Tax=Chungangia koreensis TaxID=752657 RepID=A0ABV8X918_9LACT